MTERLRILVVDDSAFARKVVREALESEPAFEVVATARDGLEALEKIAELRPDVVTLDLVMPNLDGIGVLGALPVGTANPRVVVVSMTDGESALGIAALRAGAAELVHKPTAHATARLTELRDELVAKVRIAGAARASVPLGAAPAPTVPVAMMPTSKRIVVVGASTGGPQALTRLLRALPSTFPVPIAIVLHIPVGYTQPFAERLDQECALRIVEAFDGQVLEAGQVVVAKAGWHLRIAADGDALVCRLGIDPLAAIHRPSVDVLFDSVVALGPAVVGVVLTGMGDDGATAAVALHAAGAAVLTESMSSCVIYGMPRAVKDRGASTAEAPIEDMAALLLDAVRR